MDDSRVNIAIQPNVLLDIGQAQVLSLTASRLYAKRTYLLSLYVAGKFQVS